MYKSAFMPNDKSTFQIGVICIYLRVTDTTTSIQSVIDNCPDNSTIYFPQGTVIQIDSLNVSGKRLTFFGYGATIQCNSELGAFFKMDHNKKITIIGLRFIGKGKAINWITTTSQSQYDEFTFQNCTFENENYGIYLDGVREGRIINCSFEGELQKGIYRVRSVNHDVIGCYWKNTVYGVNDDGDGSPYSAGARIIGGTMIGCQYGVRTSMVDYCSVTDVMIDYCDNPLVLLGVDIFNAKGCYITTRTINPAVFTSRGSDNRTSREVRIIGNTIASNIDDELSDAMVLRGVASGEISSNTITFWWRYGIDYADCTNLTIEKNKIHHDWASTSPDKYSVYESDKGSDSNLIANNEYNGKIIVNSSRIINQIGFPNDKKGEVIFSPGEITKTLVHGMYFTPKKYNIMLTPSNKEAAMRKPYISAVDSTTFSITLSEVATANAGITWIISK